MIIIRSRVRYSDDRILRHASAVPINYRKWVGSSIDTTDPSHSVIQHHVQ